MHEILFKAKRLDNGEWVEGYYQKRKDAFENDEHLIFRCESCHTWEYVEVYAETICQYTGLTDKNGNKVWENDVVYARRRGLSGKGIIEYEKGTFVIKDTSRKRTYSLFGEWMFRVDGNIFDNPELLENE